MVAQNELPSELLSFALHSPSTSETGPRCGTLSFPNRTPIATPHYIALTSRGTVPHITQDSMRSSTSLNGIYAALEDFTEKAPDAIPPVYKYPAPPHDSPLRGFIALQQDALLVLGPRRIPPVTSPASNTHTAISTCTSVGFRMLENDDYVAAVQKLRPDVVLALADVVYGAQPGAKRVENMGDRTLAWLTELIDSLHDETVETATTALFAPILPIEKELQAYYLSHLQEELKPHIHGLTLYSPTSLPAIPPHLLPLPRLLLHPPSTPQTLLTLIALGHDIFTLPFLPLATDAGIALCFSFPAPSAPPSPTSTPPPLPLGIDMWHPQHSSSLAPLKHDCQCYTCTHHHRAYVQHLLSAKEMLGWVLLQIHNHSVMDAFFSGVRASIAAGDFAVEEARFARTYEAQLPAMTGLGPRVRGYQFRSGGPGETKKNPPAYRALDGGLRKVAGGASVLGRGRGAGVLEGRGVGAGEELQGGEVAEQIG